MRKELYEEYFMALSELVTLLATGITGLLTLVVIITSIFKGQLEVVSLGFGTYICYETCINSLYWLSARIGKIKWLKNNIDNNMEDI